MLLLNVCRSEKCEGIETIIWNTNVTFQLEIPNNKNVEIINNSLTYSHENLFCHKIYDRQYEVVRDPVEHSLNSEAKLISQIRVLLKDKCEAAWDKLAVLEDIRQRLELDLQDKTTALAIDINQIELSERSGGISHKPDSIKCPNGLVHLSFISFT